jgi:hypothetical protein
MMAPFTMPRSMEGSSTSTEGIQRVEFDATSSHSVVDTTVVLRDLRGTRVRTHTLVEVTGHKKGRVGRVVHLQLYR